jgi:polar amino acid transport system permease protein
VSGKASDTETLAPPGARPRRAVSRFRPFIGPAVAAEVLAVAVTILTWAQLYAFDQSLVVSSTALTAIRVFEIAIGSATLIVPIYGARAVARSFRARQLANVGKMHEARIAVEDAQHDVLWVVGLGLIAAIIAFIAFVMAANHGHVRQVLFNWSLIWSSRTALVRGFWWNIRLFLVAEVLVLIWSLIVAVVRQLPGPAFAPVRFLAIAYTDVFRGVPAIIVIYLIGFGFPLAGVEPFATHMSGDTQLFWLGVVALTLVYGAYVAEVYRAGLESVHWSQTAAARSLGLSQIQTLRYVVVPQAVRRILPPLLNDFVALQKDTALVSVVGLAEILNVSNILKNNHFNLSPVTGAALFFLIITIPCTRFVDYLIKRDRARTQAG